MKIDQSLLIRVEREYRKTLRNLDVPHPKLLVLFSAPPSSGKTTLAKQLEQRLQAVRLENDPIRLLATKWFPGSSMTEKSLLTHQFGDYFWPKLAVESPNGLWVIDSSIDRMHDSAFGFGRAHGFAWFIVAIEIPLHTHRDWIVAGGDREFNTMDNYLARMHQRRSEQRAFLARHKPDLTVRPPYDVDSIVRLVEQKLATLY